MLASSTTRDTDEFLQSLAFLWAQLQNDKLPAKNFDQLSSALNVTANYYTKGKTFDQPKQIKELVLSVLTNLQLNFTLEETQPNDREYTLNLSLTNRLSPNRFQTLINSMFNAIREQATTQQVWNMSFTTSSSSQSVSHQLQFIRQAY